MEEEQQRAVGRKRTGRVVTTIVATAPGTIRDRLGSGRYVVLFGRPPHAPVRLKSCRFLVKLYNTDDQDIVESLMQEQPYRHYLGYFTRDISTDDLRDEINATVWSRYKVTL